ncbi:MAG: complex I subunit 5 family protein [Haloarculaceae archaeon]
MTALVVAPMLVALVTAILTLGVRFAPRLQRALSVAGVLTYVGVVALLLSRVLGGNVLVYQVSGWPAPYGITLVADALSGFMLGLTALVALAAVVFSVGYVDVLGQRVSYHPLFHFMLTGATGAFLTGDVFNLFVWFEVMLMPSYVMVVFYSGREHTSAALKYTVLNLLGGAVMLLAIGGLYATTGTLNMADMAQRLGNAGGPGAAIADPAPVLGLAALLLAVFALKAGLAPFQFWVPAAYRAAPAPATAMLAGVTKKVGIYAIIRLYFSVFGAATLPKALALPGLWGRSFLAFFGPVLFVMATASILLGGIGAVSRDRLEDVLSYSSIGQVGFIVLPLAVVATLPPDAAGLRRLGIVAALVYALNHALAKSLLFMVSGTVRESIGSTGFEDLGGLVRAQPLLAAPFFVGSLALVGIPPLTGFFGKFFVFDAAGSAMAAGASGATLALAVALAGAILTIAYLTRAWNRGFWGPASDLVANARPRPLLLAVLAGLALSLIVLGVGFDPVLHAARAGADAALDRSGYVRAVLGVTP